MPNDLFASTPPPPQGEIQTEHVRLYEHLRTSEDCAEDRAYANDLWSRFEELGLADDAFVSRFPVECGSRIWEMQLATTLAGWGWALIPSQKRGEGPDFGIACDDGTTFWVEATAPTAGQEEVRGDPNPDKVRAPRGRVLHGAEIARASMLRYLGAMAAKREQYRRARAAGLVREGDGYVIAISGAMVPEAMIEHEDETPHVVRALYGVGDRVFHVPLDGSLVSVGVAHQDSVRKASGTEISMRAFVDGSAPEVSAVIFCGSYLKERPERRGRPPGDDFIFALNPLADRMFPFTAPPVGRVWFVGLKVDDRRKAVGGAERQTSPPDAEDT